MTHAAALGALDDDDHLQSGLGREGGHDGMLDYLERTYIAVDW